MSTPAQFRAACAPPARAPPCASRPRASARAAAHAHACAAHAAHAAARFGPALPRSRRAPPRAAASASTGDAAVPSLEEEDADADADAAALASAGNDSTQAGAAAILARAGGVSSQVAPKAAEMQAALAELSTLGAAERETLSKAAALLAKLGMKGPLLEPPAEFELAAEGDEDDDGTGI
jgi:hypothetical protein